MVKVSFRKDEVIRAVEICLGSVEKKSTMPILSHILLEVSKQQCQFVATNLDTSVSFRVPCESEGKIKMAVPARSFYEMCRGMRGADVILDYDEDRTMLTVTSDKTTYTFPCGDVSEFPAISHEKGDEVPVSIGKILPFFKKIQFSMTDPSYNKMYSGVLITTSHEGKKEAVELVTTDIHRISIVTLHSVVIPLKDITEGIVVPGKNFSEMVKVFSGIEEALFSVKEGKLTVTSGPITFTCRLIKNEFPNYRNVTGSITQIEQKDFSLIRRKELIDAVKRVTAISTDEKIQATRLEFYGDVLKMSASSEVGGSSSDEILVEKAFKTDRSIGLNARYFLEVINVVDDESVRIIIEEGLRPLTVIEKHPDYTYTHMVMPLRI